MIERTKEPLAITPFYGRQRDGTNAFIYQRFLVPYFTNFTGKAIFLDASDMLMLADIDDLNKLFDPSKAVQVVKHVYQTKHRKKYVGTAMEAANELHRFSWLPEALIGELPKSWNVLVGEQDHMSAKIAHYTLGIPEFDNYKDCNYSEDWFKTKSRMLNGLINIKDTG